MKRLLTFLALLTVYTSTSYGNSSTTCHEKPAFTGPYIGGNIGGFSHIAYRNDLDGFLTDNSGWTTVDTNVELGLQIGWDLQCQNLLLGIVGDWNWTNIDVKFNEDPNGTVGNSLQSEFDWFATLRLRAGLAVNNVALYLTGGAVAGEFDTVWRTSGNRISLDDCRWGWTVGAGVETKIFCGFSLGAEALFMNFTTEEAAFNAGGTRFAFNSSDTAVAGRFLLNYRFM